jgi:hypothetical protein
MQLVPVNSLTFDLHRSFVIQLDLWDPLLSEGFDYNASPSLSNEHDKTPLHEVAISKQIQKHHHRINKYNQHSTSAFDNSHMLHTQYTMQMEGIKL